MTDYKEGPQSLQGCPLDQELATALSSFLQATKVEATVKSFYEQLVMCLAQSNLTASTGRLAVTFGPSSESNSVSARVIVEYDNVKLSRQQSGSVLN